MTSPSSTQTAIDRYQPWRRVVEFGFWVGMTLINGIANSFTSLIEVRRIWPDFEAWKPAVWEASSGLVMLALVPAVAWFTRRFPLHWDTWRRQLPWHVLASLVFSLAHVSGMVALRKLAYASQGTAYEFGPLPVEFAYEYLKDVRSYAGMVAVIEAYRWLLRRLRGEARLLGAPDEGDPVEPVERPERFLVHKLGREFLVAAADIEWAQAAGNYVNLHVRGHDYPLRSTMNGIESRLDHGRFVRIHRSYIVNLDHIGSIEPLDAGDARVHLRDGSSVLPCSRRYREALRGRIGAV